jgi:N-carbamoylputrescine amidase
MKQLHLALCQGHWTGDVDSTAKLYAELISEAAQRGASLIGLPEFTLLPYFPASRDKAGMQWAETLTEGVSARFFSAMAQQHQVELIGSIFEREGDNYWDTAVSYGADGQLSHFTRKVHIPSGDGYHETDFFAGDVAYPVHELDTVKLAAPTCYDQWFPELARIYALNGAELIFYPTAIGGEPTAPEFDSRDAWQTVMRGHAVANGLFIAAANRVGQERVTFYGSSFICDPLGRILASASRDKDEVIDVVLEPAVREQYLNLFPLLHQRRPQTYGRLLEKAEGQPAERWQNEEKFS